MLCGFALSSLGQNTQPLGETFHAPKADIEQALKDINAYDGGKLPFAEGFVGSMETPLTSFQRAYYQYTISLTQKSDDEVVVGVNAKISAWYEDKDVSKSGYRDLPSNGRLEADLLERLRERLRKNAASAVASRVPLVSPKLLGTPQPLADSAAVPASAPDAPAVSAGGTPNFRSLAPSASATAVRAGTEPASDARSQRLQKEEQVLQEVLAGQQRPQDLVAIKRPKTRVMAAPTDTAKTLMLADAEDEFQLIKTEGEWVHIQIAGINRGWVKRSEVEMVGDVGAATVAAAATPASTAPATAAKATNADAFKQTREELSIFPGDWAALRGKNVKIIWVQPNGTASRSSRLKYVESVFRKQAPELTKQSGVEGVVVVFDAADGGMAAATLSSLQEWGKGSLSDPAFLKQCWFDPADAFTTATR